MASDNELNPKDDVEQALHAARHGATSDSAINTPLNTATDTLVHGHSHPLLNYLHYAFCKCAWMAEKAPWQTASALLLIVGCGWMCSYFGWSMLAALVLYAVYADE